MYHSLRSLIISIVFAAALISPVLISADAGAYVFWSNYNPEANVTARANNDGSGIISTMFSCTSPLSTAADETYVYQVSLGNPGKIIRAVEDGSGAVDFITGIPNASAVAVDDTYIYFRTTNTIGRANLDGTGVNMNWITGVAFGYGLTVDANYVYISGDSSIARANIDGTGLNTTWINGIAMQMDIAVDGTYIYWTTYTNYTVGRAALDGSDVDESWITGLGVPWGIDVDASYVYVAQNWDHIARANLDGTGLNTTWIYCTGACRGMAVTESATPVDLVSFNARRFPDRIRVSWETGTELETAGFHLWRADGRDKDFVRVTDEMILAEGGPAQGAEYRWLDTTAEPNRQYWYKLEDVSFSGLSAFHGPVRARGKKLGPPGGREIVLSLRTPDPLKKDCFP